MKIPVMAVVGDQEEAANNVTPRFRAKGERNAAAQALDAFVADLAARVARREN
jgi:threonyl-tRNA synthetase